MNKNNRLKLNNKGVSMIEIIVVVMIMGIMATAVGVNISAIYNRNASNAAQKLSNVLDSTRVEAMNRADGSVFVRLSKDSEHNIVATVIYKSVDNVESNGDVVVLGNGGLKVSVMKMVDDPENPGAGELEEAYFEIGSLGHSTVDLVFDKGTGAFKKTDNAEPDYSAILFEGSRKCETVLVWDTGRSYVLSVN